MDQGGVPCPGHKLSLVRELFLRTLCTPHSASTPNVHGSDRV